MRGGGRSRSPIGNIPEKFSKTPAETKLTPNNSANGAVSAGWPGNLFGGRNAWWRTQSQSDRKHPRKVLEDASRDEAHAKQLGQWGGKCGMAGKSLWRSECVVADAVAVRSETSPKSSRRRQQRRSSRQTTRPMGR